MNKNFFGAFNGICFLHSDNGQLLADRANRKEPILFAESLIDIAENTRSKAEVFIVSTPPVLNSPDHKHVFYAGQLFTIIDQTQTLYPVGGFGLQKEYCAVVTDSSETKIILKISLPELSEYNIRWKAISINNNVIGFPQDIQVTVFSDHEWTADETNFRISSKQEIEFVLFIESKVKQFPLSDTIIVARSESWKEALQVRAILGKNFVPCFEWNAATDPDGKRIQNLVDRTSHRCAVYIDFPFCKPSAVNSNIFNLTATDLNLENLKDRNFFSSDKKITVSPRNFRILGYALYFAIQHGAELYFDNIAPDLVVLSEKGIEISKRWLLDDLNTTILGDMLSNELVICESVIRDFLIIQAIGYAFAYGKPVAFIDELKELVPPGGFENCARGIKSLKNIANKKIPAEIRQSIFEKITVFTEDIPLHLAEVNHSTDNAEDYWKNYSVISHLPSYTASLLIPGYYHRENQQTPDVPFTVIFDTLSSHTNTEGDRFSLSLQEQLSLPISLTAKDADAVMLSEILKLLEIDMLLLITHGADDFIHDYRGIEINSSMISQWSLKGNPIVFNNSCSSWVTTGNAFIEAGARGMIATLWPIENKVAHAVGLEMAMRLGQDEKPIAELLWDVLREKRDRNIAVTPDQHAYIYIGLPFDELIITKPINSSEKLHLLGQAFLKMDEICRRLLYQSDPETAHRFRQIFSRQIEARTAALYEENTGSQLQPPLHQFSLLEMPYLLSLSTFSFNKELLNKSISEEQNKILDEMDSCLRFAIDQLITWNERHEAVKPRERIEEHQFSYLDVSLSPVSLHKYLYNLVANYTLPFVLTMEGFRRLEMAWNWFSISGKLLQTENETENWGTEDELIIARISKGITQKSRAIKNFNESDTVALADEFMEVSFIEGNEKANLLNKFGIALVNLKEYHRATAFYIKALEFVENNSEEYYNIFSNLTKVKGLIAGSDSIIKDFDLVIKEQFSKGDYVNAFISQCNLIRYCVNHNFPIEQEIEKRSFTIINYLEESRKKQARAETYSLFAIAHATDNKYEEAKNYNNLIATELTPFIRDTEVCLFLTDYCMWLYDKQFYSLSLERAEWMASVFHDLHLELDEMKALLQACYCLQMIFERKKSAENAIKYVAGVQRLGKLAKDSVEFKKEFPTNTEVLTHNMESLWHYADREGNRDLAYGAYLALRAWNRPLPDSGKLLANTMHPVNKKMVHAAAHHAYLTRHVSFYLNKAGQLIIKVATHYSDSAPQHFPNTLYCYFPIEFEGEYSAEENDAECCCKSLMFALEKGRGVTVTSIPTICKDKNGFYSYIESWGSTIIHYSYSIYFEEGLIPTLVTYNFEKDPLTTTYMLLNHQGINIYVDYNGRKTSTGIAYVAFEFVYQHQLYDALKSNNNIFNKSFTYIRFWNFIKPMIDLLTSQEA